MPEQPSASSSNATAPASPGTVALLLLAAGASSRMGQPKQLLPYRGRTLLRHAAETAVATGCAPVVLVTGAVHEALVAEVADLPVQVVRNLAWETGMASSIRVGLAAAAPAQPTAFLIMLSDQPLVTPALLRQLIAQQQRTHAPVVAAAYGDTLGVPAVFDRTMLPALQQLKGAQGAGLLIKSLGAAVGRVPFPGGLMDVDTPEQYAALVAAAPAAGSS
ncbi:nucleotidyltransferase family protein [Hymenobacter sp. BT770]|uniref:nucleotidyltransferase family protein n=1 Tax=Hymenobacter sp. BT770 TaxID=2886942 RepID=UPI001D0F9ED9|nr:nucleotidyltransferase family protein [Hymenobacter sp. BT770]MCC3155048.1 nucleotidyltransferase family protein [Hymenobacter sp. BT770]MDO3416934.1 nucleotidyltransferase family protein [Hymenobacter sp. BT770]